MMARARQLLAASLAIAAVVALMFLSRVAWRIPGGDTAELRLSWRMPAPSYRHCRPPTEAELAGVLPHMRPSEVCTDTAIPFRLTIRLDGDTLYSKPVERSGTRARTITIYSSFPVAPGSYALDVTFLPELPPGSVGGVLDVATRSSASDSADALQDLATTLNARVEAGPREVIMVSIDANGRLHAVDPR